MGLYISKLSTFLTLLAATSTSLATPIKERQTLILHLTGITYTYQDTYSTPAHQIGPYEGLSFNLTNYEVDYTTFCTAQDQEPFAFEAGSERVFSCVDTLGPRGTSANFTFVQSTNTISVNQTWVYEGELVHAGATGNITYNCGTSSYKNPDWQEGEIYSQTNTTCGPANLDMFPDTTYISPPPP